MNPLRPLMLGLTAAAATSLLLALPIEYPPAAPGDLLDWWTEHGTPVATIALLRLGVLAFTIWVSAAGVLTALAAALRVRPPETVVRALPSMMRRWLVGAAVAGIAAAPSAASAAIPVAAVPAAAAAAPADDDSTGGFRLVDRGSAADTITLVEIGHQRAAGNMDRSLAGHTGNVDSGDAVVAAEAAGAALGTADRIAGPGLASAVDSASARIADRASGATPEAGPTAAKQAEPAAVEAAVWTVQPGDHLWGIADATVASRTGKADKAETWRYWRALIAANESVVGSDPDLIRPGTRISLPPL